jgi:predicted RNA-binding Zn ribbon-like protein
MILHDSDLFSANASQYSRSDFKYAEELWTKHLTDKQNSAKLLNSQDIQKTCDYCCKKFVSTDQRKKYCSKTCGDSAKAKRHRDKKKFRYS